MGVRFECLIFGQFSFSHQKIVSYLPPFVFAYHQFAVQVYVWSSGELLFAQHPIVITKNNSISINSNCRLPQELYWVMINTIDQSLCYKLWSSKSEAGSTITHVMRIIIFGLVNS